MHGTLGGPCTIRPSVQQSAVPRAPICRRVDCVRRAPDSASRERGSMRANLSSVVVAAVCAGFFACGGSATSGTSQSQENNAEGGAGGPVTTRVDAGAGEAAAEAAPPLDHGSPSSTYPAFAPSFGQISTSGGYVMKNPVIVPI